MCTSHRPEEGADSGPRKGPEEGADSAIYPGEGGIGEEERRQRRLEREALWTYSDTRGQDTDSRDAAWARYLAVRR